MRFELYRIILEIREIPIKKSIRLGGFLFVGANCSSAQYVLQEYR